MIGKLSDKLTLALIRRGQIDADERELYAYGFFILLSDLFFGIIACLIGAVCGVILEAILFYIAFRCIRQYAGGYHAKTETRCQVLSSLAILLAVLAVKAMEAFSLQRCGKRYEDRLHTASRNRKCAGTPRSARAWL